MSQQEQNLQPEPPYTQAEVDESQFDEEALHARRRQYLRFGASIAILAVVILTIPFTDHVKASGRVAPLRWAQVRSEVPGVVREATRRRTIWPSASERTEVSCRLGRYRRRVLLFAWLTLLPVCTPFPVMLQRRDMIDLPCFFRSCPHGIPARKRGF